MHPSLRLGLVAGIPVLSAIIVLVGWRFYSRWRNNRLSTRTRTASPPQVPPHAVEPKENLPVKDAEPLTSKESSEVAKSFEKIYSRKLKWPERIIIDPGKEFMGRVTSLMKRHNVIIQRSEAGNHRAQAFVERANRTLSERLFSFQYGKEMSNDDNERSREWVERLPAVLKSMNNEVTRLTGKEPLEVLKSKDISINAPKYNRPVGFDEVRLSLFSKVRFLFAPGEYEGGDGRRATDPVWSLEIFGLSHSKVSPDQPVMYYLSGGPKRSFVREELQVVPEDTEAPPKSVK